MKLSCIFENVPIMSCRYGSGKDLADTDLGSAKAPDPEISGIYYQSQNVKAGGLFVALQGLSVDGHKFIPNALESGAVAAIVQAGTDLPEILAAETAKRRPFYLISVANTRQAMAMVAANYYRHPSHNLVLIGVTGTNGKTTTARLIETMLVKAGYRPGAIGTREYRYGGQFFDNPMTTPESPDLQRILTDMADGGITHVVMEVSSHGIDRHRVDGCSFDVGVFTNLSQDHLDYHGTMNAYWQCKKSWFTENLLSGPKGSKARIVSNCENEKGRELAADLADLAETERMVTVGQDRAHVIHADEAEYGMNGISCAMATPDGCYDVRSPLIGRHNLENILCAVGVGYALKLSPAVIKEGIESADAAPGRLEAVPNMHRRHVYVDYAHTPDALERVLLTLKRLATGRIICIFGCGGDRDKGKRKTMGHISAALSDLTIVTSDNPRTEDPKRIICDICRGIAEDGIPRLNTEDVRCGFEKKGYAVAADRQTAIILGIAASKPEDVILIAGKGDETNQIIGNETFPFDDRSIAGEALSLDINQLRQLTESEESAL